MKKQILNEGFGAILRTAFKGGVTKADDVLKLFRSEGVRALKGSSKYSKYIDEVAKGRRGTDAFDKAIKANFRKLAKEGKPILDKMGKMAPGAAKDYSKAIAFKEADNILSSAAGVKRLEEAFHKTIGGKVNPHYNPAEGFKYIDDVLDDAVAAQKKRIQGMADEAVDAAKGKGGGGGGGGGGKTKPIKPPKIDPKTGKPYTKWAKFKRNLKITGYSLLAAGGAITVAMLWGNYKWFRENIPEEKAEEILQPVVDKINRMLKFFPCIAEILDDEGVYLEISEVGNIKVVIPKTGVPEYDAVGGLAFYPHGIVQKVNQPRATGSFACAGEHLSEGDIEGFIINAIIEQRLDTNPADFGGDGNKTTGVKNIQIRWQTDAEGKDTTTASGGASGPKKNCDDKRFPHEKGCYSAEISSIQNCIGVYVDGVLNDKTIQKLDSLGYDTSQGLTYEIYSAIAAKCDKITKKPGVAKKVDVTYKETIKNGSLVMADATKTTIKYKDTAPNLSVAQLKDLDKSLLKKGFTRDATSPLPAGAKFIWKK